MTYEEVAAEVIKHLKHDLEFGAPKEQALAHLWLEHGVDRSLCKGPVLAAPMAAAGCRLQMAWSIASISTTALCPSANTATAWQCPATCVCHLD